MRRDDPARQRQELASRLGLAKISEDADLVDVARSLDRLRWAGEIEAGARRRVRETEERYARLLTGLGARTNRSSA